MERRSDTGEPDPADARETEATASMEPGSPVRPRATGPLREGAGTGIALGIVSAVGFASLGFLLAFAFFAALAIYAIVKAVGDEGSGNPVVVALVTVLLATTFVVLLCVGLGKLGGSLTPKKRDRGSSG